LHDDQGERFALIETRSIESSIPFSPLKDSLMKLTPKFISTLCLCGAVAASGLLVNASFAGPGDRGGHAPGPRMQKQHQRDGRMAGPGRGMGHLPPKARGEIDREIKSRIDTNKDGVLDDAERSAVRERLQAKRSAKAEKMISRFDADGDGALNKQELSKAHDAVKQRKAEFKGRHDRNRDGRMQGPDRGGAKREMARKLRNRA
jgi:hypothetical protein